MPRYTDLNAILGDLHERLDFLLSEYGEFDAYYCGFEEAVERIEDVSTVDAEPVRHGQWIECDYKCMEHGFVETYAKGGLCCSECKTGFKKSELRIKSYCPNCGAAMTRCGDQ